VLARARACVQANGAGVEILENRPATHPEMGDGIYTLKHYHIDRRFPGWLRAIAPKVSGSAGWLAHADLARVCVAPAACVRAGPRAGGVDAWRNRAHHALPPPVACAPPPSHLLCPPAPLFLRVRQSGCTLVETAYNCYPWTKTEVRLPLFSKFLMVIESKHANDRWHRPFPALSCVRARAPRTGLCAAYKYVCVCVCV